MPRPSRRPMRGVGPGVRSGLMTSSVQLSICGDVERPARLTLAELRSVMDAEVVADFHCREGWSRLGERWRGVRLRSLLALVGAADAVGYVTVGCGDYTAVLTREQAEDERVLLALEHEGAVSPRPAGFPRLVGPSDWDCFLSVKSVDRIEVTRQPQQATAATIALARLERLAIWHPSPFMG
jgi:methionine sulfoxide reductase catalytic subunit